MILKELGADPTPVLAGAESIDLRATHVRDNEGRLHIIRNGNLDTVSNYFEEVHLCRRRSGSGLRIGLDHVYEGLAAIGAELRRESDFVLEPIDVMGLESFGEYELTIREAPVAD